MVLEPILLLHGVVDGSFLVFVLLLHDFGLLGLLLLTEVDGLLDFTLFVLSLLADHVVALLTQFLTLRLRLQVHHFLLKMRIINCIYFMQFLFVPLLQSVDLGGSLFFFLDFLPGLHLFLLQ